MKILVTGGAGFIGSNIAKQLIKNGHDVSVLDNLSTGNVDNVTKNTPFYRNNLHDDEVKDILKNGFDVICHQAAQINLRLSIDHPIEDIQADIAGSVNLFENAVKNGVKHIVFASSGGAIYGEQSVMPTPESAKIKPESPYAINKYMIEMYMGYYNKLFGIKTTSMRYANVFGPGQSSKSEAGVVSIFINKMLRNEDVTIYGSGEQTRDFVFVKDVVAANVSAIENCVSGEINIGTSKELSVNELFSKLKNISNYGKSAFHADAIKGEVMKSVLDNKHAEKVLGWKPQVEIEEGLGLTYNYYLDQFNDGKHFE